MLLEQFCLRRTMEDGLVQWAGNFIFQHVDVVFPVFLPVLASPVYQEPSPGEKQADAANDEGQIFFIAQVLSAKDCKVPCKCGSDQSPEIRSPLPIQTDFKLSYIKGVLKGLFPAVASKRVAVILLIGHGSPLKERDFEAKEKAALRSAQTSIRVQPR